MAEAKKAAVKKAAPKKTVKAETSKSPVEELALKRAELLDYRKSHAAGELVNPRAITAAKKEIARLMTRINMNAKETK